MCIVWFLALLPVPQLKAFLSDLLLGLTGILGDSFVLESPSKRSLILSKVRHDCDWLRTKCGCEKVAIIAHSQGAYVAANAFEQYGKKIDLFITFGSGLKKLEMLLRLDKTRPLFSFMFGLAIPLTISSLILALFPVYGADAWIFRLGVSCLPIVAVVSIVTLFREQDPLEHRVAELRKAFGEWIDYYASRDPVPAGPLSGVSSIRVTNQRSLIRDYTSYWGNRDEFVLATADRLLDELGYGSLTGSPLPDTARSQIARNRIWRVRALMLGRMVFVASFVFVWSANAFYFPGEFAAIWNNFKNNSREIMEAAMNAVYMALSRDAMLKGGPLAAVYVSIFLGISYAAAMLLWRLWDWRAFLDVLKRKPVFTTKVAAALYLVLTSWTCIMAVRFYSGGGLMSGALFFVALVQASGFYAIAIALILQALLIVFALLLLWLVVKLLENTPRITGWP